MGGKARSQNRLRLPKTDSRQRRVDVGTWQVASAHGSGQARRGDRGSVWQALTDGSRMARSPKTRGLPQIPSPVTKRPRRGVSDTRHFQAKALTTHLAALPRSLRLQQRPKGCASQMSQLQDAAGLGPGAAPGEGAGLGSCRTHSRLWEKERSTCACPAAEHVRYRSTV